jgi:HD superfamily phosphohydrolase
MEIRDPLHVFVRLDAAEQAVLNSPPFQRLRSIHQLALTYLVYPGATHRRFEHSLGVMELATRIFDVVTTTRNITHDEVREIIPDEDETVRYWRRVLRLAALCHDVGHLPFSHAAESELLPPGIDHESISRAHILSPAMRAIWSEMEPPITPEHIALLAVGPARGESVRPWQAILGEIITGDVFGADRMDYLLRDSLHTGVAYGRFDHHRLIDTLRILPGSWSGPENAEEEAPEPTLGITSGGVQSAEALLLARYFSFSQVYFHRVRVVYDIHLKDFLKAWLADTGGFLPHKPGEHLLLTDNHILVALQTCAGDQHHALGSLARRVVDREHRFGLVYSPSPADLVRNADASKQIAAALGTRYGADSVRHQQYGKPTSPFDFPVLQRDGQVFSSLGVSEVLASVPTARYDYVFMQPEHCDDAAAWLKGSRDAIIEPPEFEEEDELEEGADGAAASL